MTGDAGIAPDPPSGESLPASARRSLLEVARRSIHHGLSSGEPYCPDPAAYPAALRVRLASFVTLKLEGRLRGCIGQLKEERTLVDGVASNAFGAAFRDRRFAPVGAGELDRIDIGVSVLSEPQPMRFAGQAELLAQLCPGRDGLILREGGRAGTFLPTVWEVLPEPEVFLRELKCKAGLPADYWSPTLEVSRYSALSFSERSAGG